MSKNKFEERVEAGAENFQKAVIDWVKNDRFFDGFRNTYARILLVVLAIAGMIGGLVYCYSQESGVLWYIGFALFSVLAQKLSIRFALDGDDVADEYQTQRRNAAYRRAYKVAGALIGWFLFAVLAMIYLAYYAQNGRFSLLPNASFSVFIDGYRILVLLVFIVGSFSLLPYFTWGFKGEPFRSKNEPND